ENSLCADGLSSCSGGKTGFVVGGDGSVSFCDRLIGHSEAIVGNIKDSSLLEIWNGYHLKQFVDPAPEKFEGTACGSCSMISACSKRMRCYYRVQMVDQRFYGPDYMCPRVPAPTETKFF
ncbi:MAG: SPASM domain-containing protein, partial [Acidobacteriota bacterium]